MSAEDKIPIEIDIGSKHDPKGVNDAKNGFSGLEKSITAVSQKAELLGKVMRGLGFIAIIQQAVAIFSALRERINAAKEAAEKLAEAEHQAAADKAVQDRIKDYDALKKSIADVNAQLARQAELEAIAKGGQRGIDDARSMVDEQADLAGIAFDDPERKEKEDAVRARYARQRALTTASRAKEDAVLQRQALQQSAAQKSADADRLGAKADEIASGLRGERAVEDFWTTAAKDATGKDWLTGAPKETKASKSFQAAAAAAKKRADDLEKQLDEAEKEIDDLRNASAFERRKADTLYSEYQAGDIRVQAADMAGVRDIRSSDAAVSAARDKRAAEAKAKTDAIAAKEREAADARGRAGGMTSDIEALRGRVRSEERDVYQAERAAADLTPSQRRGRQGRDAAAEVDRQRGELRAANTALAQAISSMSEAIAEALAVAKAAETAAKQLKSRQNTARTDAGNID